MQKPPPPKQPTAAPFQPAPDEHRGMTVVLPPAPEAAPPKQPAPATVRPTVLVGLRPVGPRWVPVAVQVIGGRVVTEEDFGPPQDKPYALEIVVNLLQRMAAS